jgi:hypothetical protein
MKAGRNVLGRAYQATAYCQSCGIRRTVGEPRTTETWYLRLREITLNPEQTDLLLVAAAEFSELSEEAGEYALAVAYVDWLVGVTRQSGVQVTHDGSPSRTMTGEVASKVSNAVHRHPDPIPFAELPRTWQR